jgi:hypothetical protein
MNNDADVLARKVFARGESPEEKRQLNESMLDTARINLGKYPLHSTAWKFYLRRINTLLDILEQK